MNEYIESYEGVEEADGNFPLMPEGNYKIEVKESKIESAKSSGNLTWYLTLKVLNPQFANRLLWFSISMGDKAKGFRKGALTSLGIDTNDSVDLINDVIDKQAMAVVYHNDYNGKINEKVKRLRSIKEDSEEAKELNEFEGDEVLGNTGSIPF